MHSSRGSLPPGWCRIEIPRRIVNTPKKYDVYFYSHDGVKLRSFPDIKKYFKESLDVDEVERSNFNFLPVQTPVLRDTCDVYNKLEHHKYLTVNRERLKRLFRNEDGTVMQPSVQDISVEPFKRKQFTTNENDKVSNSHKVLESDWKASEYKTNAAIDNKFDHSSQQGDFDTPIKKENITLKKTPNDTVDTRLSFAPVALSSFADTADGAEINLQATPLELCKEHDVSVTRAKAMGRVTSADTRDNFEGQSSTSSINFPCRKRQRLAREVKKDKVETQGKECPENLATLVGKGRSSERRERLKNSKYFRNRSSTKVKSIETIKKARFPNCGQFPIRSKTGKTGSKRKSMLNEKKKGKFTPVLTSGDETSSTLRRSKRVAPLKIDNSHELRVNKCKKCRGNVEELKENHRKSNEERSVKASKTCKKSKELWLQCHRYSDTEKVDFIQKYNKTWTSSYITKCCGTLNGWTRTVTQRQGGSSSGTWDVVYRSPGMEKFRSKREIQRYFKSNSIKISPDLFCFKSSVLDFSKRAGGQHMETDDRKYGQTLSKNSRRAPRESCKFGQNLYLNVQSNEVEEGISSKNAMHTANSRYFREATRKKNVPLQNKIQKQLKSLEADREVPSKEEGCNEHCRRVSPVLTRATERNNVREKLSDLGFSCREIGGSLPSSLAIANGNTFESIRVSEASHVWKYQSETVKGNSLKLSNTNISCYGIQSARVGVTESSNPSTEFKRDNTVVRTDENSSTLIDNRETVSWDKLKRYCSLGSVPHFKTIREVSAMGINKGPGLSCQLERLVHNVRGSSRTGSQMRREMYSSTSSQQSNFNETKTLTDETSLPSSSKSITLCFSARMEPREKLLSHFDARIFNPLDLSSNKLMLRNTLLGTLTLGTFQNAQNSETDALISQQNRRSQYSNVLSVAPHIITGVRPGNLKRKILLTDKFMPCFKDKNEHFKKKAKNGVTEYSMKRDLAERNFIQDFWISTHQGGFYDSKSVNEASCDNETRISIDFNKSESVTNRLISRVVKVSQHILSPSALKFANVAQSNGRKSITINDSESGEETKTEEKGDENEVCDNYVRTIIESINNDFIQKDERLSFDLVFDNDCNTNAQVTGIMASRECDSQRMGCFDDRDSRNGEFADLDSQFLKTNFASDGLKKSGYFKDSVTDHEREGTAVTSNTVEICNEDEGKQRSGYHNEAITCSGNKPSTAIDTDLDQLVGGGYFETNISSCDRSLMQDGKMSSMQKKDARDIQLAVLEEGTEYSINQTDEADTNSDSRERFTYPISNNNGNSDTFQKDVSKVKRRNLRTGLRSPYFRKQKKSRCKREDNFTSQREYPRPKTELKHSYFTFDKQRNFFHSKSQEETSLHARASKPEVVHTDFLSNFIVASDQTGNIRSSSLLSDDWKEATCRNMGSVLESFGSGKNQCAKKQLENLEIDATREVNYNKDPDENDTLESGAICCKCGYILNDNQVPQRIFVCSACENGTSSSRSEALGVENASLRPPYENDWHTGASKCKHLTRKLYSHAVSPILKRNYFQSLGLVNRSRFISDLAKYDMTTFCNKSVISLGRCQNAANKAEEAEISDKDTPEYLDSRILPQRRRYALRRRLGIRRVCHRSIGQLPQDSFGNPSLHLGINAHCMIAYDVSPTGQPHCLVASNMTNTNKHTYYNGCNVNLFQTPGVNEGACMANINEGQSEHCFDWKSTIRSLLGFNINEDVIKCSNNNAAKTQEQRASYSRRGIDIGRGVITSTCCSKSRPEQSNTDVCVQNLHEEDTIASWHGLSGYNSQSKQRNLFLCSGCDSSIDINKNTASERTGKSHRAKAVCLNDKKSSYVTSFGLRNCTGKSLRSSSKSGSPTGGKLLQGKHTERQYIPPKSPYGLIQEQLYENPWKLLIACLFLNRTTGKQAIPVIGKFFKLWPDPETTMVADWQMIEAVIKPLGLGEVRAKRIVRFSKDYVQKYWTYPIELFGIGKYGNDAYRIFCLGEWEDVQPEDHKLNLYHEWLVEQKRLGLL